MVVNAAGALQSGLRDDLDAIHHRMVAALAEACCEVGLSRLVHISAVGAQADADTAFMRSKASGDACLRRSRVAWIILRPGLVIGPGAYGGSALLRMLASMPLVQPLVMADRRIQTVGSEDLARVVVDAVESRLPARSEIDVVEDESQSLREVVGTLRRWLGVPQARISIDLPDSVAFSIAGIADLLGHLGWRSPLRTTALRVLSAGVVGDPRTLRSLSDRRLKSLSENLRIMPSTLQERWFARLYLLLPLLIAVLALFWVSSGMIALATLPAAAAQSGLAPVDGRALVALGALLDVALGLAILYRPWARAAALGMVCVGLVYLLLGTVLRADLWADPLGPLLKILPASMLALVAAALLDSGR